MRDLTSLDNAVQALEGELEQMRNAFRKSASDQGNTFNNLQKVAADVGVLKAQVAALKEGLDKLFNHLKESKE